jgi:predicted O-methyltransferase YrrM
MNAKEDWSVNWSDKPFEDLKKVLDYVKLHDDYSYQCSTHIDVLNDAINIANVKKIIEFGGGYWSTSLLLNKCESLITIEQGQNVPKELNDSWAEKLEDLYGKNPKWNFIKSSGPHDWKTLKFNKCDMVFVDGFPSARHEVLQYFIDNNCPIIVAHDTEHDGFEWSKVDVKEYKRIDYCGYKENKSSLWTKDQNLIAEILKLPHYVIINGAMVRVFKKSMKKIISFSLWGENPIYWIGALKNIQLAKVLYPDWVCRFYVDATSSPELIKTIDQADCEMILMEPSEEFSGLFWRFYAAEDADIMICRDADSRLSRREVDAVKQWLDTDSLFHIMRDDQQHTALIMGGMWGCRNTEGMKDLIEQYQHKCFKGTDQYFLAQIIYPQVRDYAVIHDSYNHFGDGADFPTPRIKDEFVGRVVGQDDDEI